MSGLLSGREGNNETFSFFFHPDKVYAGKDSGQQKPPLFFSITDRVYITVNPYIVQVEILKYSIESALPLSTIEAEVVVSTHVEPKMAQRLT